VTCQKGREKLRKCVVKYTKKASSAGKNASRAASDVAIVTKGYARFTVIDTVCVRMEYAAEHGFIDDPTLFAFNRLSRCGDARISGEGSDLIIETDRLRVEYRDDGKPFHAGNLRVIVIEDGKEITWTPGMKNERNLGGPLATLDGINKEAPLSEGLLSRGYNSGTVAPKRDSTGISSGTVLITGRRSLPYRQSRERRRCHAVMCWDLGTAAGMRTRRTTSAISSRNTATTNFRLTSW
jgi:hypothetical protein